VLIGAAGVDLGAFAIVLAFQLSGQGQLAPLTAVLGTLLIALVAAVIATYTVEYSADIQAGKAKATEEEKSEANETRKALEPIYSEIKRNVDRFREFQPGSTAAWDLLQKQWRHEAISPTLDSQLTRYYSNIVDQKRMHESAWAIVSDAVYREHEREPGFKSRCDDLSDLVLKDWAHLVDGDLAPLLSYRIMERYWEITADATGKPSEDVLRKIKEEISKVPFVIQLRALSHNLIDESETLLIELSRVLRPVSTS